MLMAGANTEHSTILDHTIFLPGDIFGFHRVRLIVTYNPQSLRIDFPTNDDMVPAEKRGKTK